MLHIVRQSKNNLMSRSEQQGKYTERLHLNLQSLLVFTQTQACAYYHAHSPMVPSYRGLFLWA